MAKDGVSESSLTTGVSEEDQGEVGRRLALGLGGTAILGFLALIPTESLDLSTPTQPAFAYLVPVIEALEEYNGIENQITYAEWPAVQNKVNSILGKPLQLKENLMQVAKLEQDSKKQEKMRFFAREACHYLSQVRPRGYSSFLPAH